MNRYARRARRFFWWCAAADAGILDEPDAPRLDGIKYAAVGALVCLTTTVAACGWMHNAATTLAGEPYGIPLAVGLGLMMGALVFCMERVLVVSIRQDAALTAKLAAFVWRAVIASLAAALVTTPFALAYFNNGILARLDDEKLALMVEKRRAVDGVFGLKDKATAIAAVDRDLASNRAQRDQLPADVLDLSAAAADCEREHAALQRTLQPRIAGAGARSAATLREINEYPDQSSYLRRRLGALNGQIVEWRNALAAKARACRDIAEHFAAARQEYHSRLDQQWQEQLARKQDAQGRLDQAQRDAGTTLARSDAVVVRATAPDLSARVRALGQMADRDRLVAVVLVIIYGFFFLIDIMPVLAKLVMRTTYDRRIAGDYRRAVAQIEADTVIAEAGGAMRAEIAVAERVGVETLLHQGGAEAVRDLAKLRLQAESDKAEVAAPFAQVNNLIEGLRRTQARADDVAERYAGRPDLFRHIEAVREALSQAMERAATMVKTQLSATPSA